MLEALTRSRYFIAGPEHCNSHLPRRNGDLLPSVAHAEIAAERRIAHRDAVCDGCWPLAQRRSTAWRQSFLSSSTPFVCRYIHRRHGISRALQSPLPMALQAAVVAPWHTSPSVSSPRHRSCLQSQEPVRLPSPYSTFHPMLNCSQAGAVSNCPAGHFCLES